MAKLGWNGDDPERQRVHLAAEPGPKGQPPMRSDQGGAGRGGTLLQAIPVGVQGWAL